MTDDITRAVRAAGRGIRTVVVFARKRRRKPVEQQGKDRFNFPW